MAVPQQYTAKLSERVVFNPKYNLLQLELIKPNLIEFEAGQYISVEIGSGDPASAGQERRAYSIASAPFKNYGIDLCVDVVGNGKGTTWLKNLKPGDEVKFLGPLGRFTIAGEPKEKKLLLVATGCGVAPIRSMLDDLLETKKDQREIWFLWGLRYVEDMFWEEKFRQIDEYYPNFHYRLLLSQPPLKWPVERGHVTDQIKLMELGADWGVYACGNREMVAEVTKMAHNQGVPETQIHFEKF